MKSQQARMNRAVSYLTDYMLTYHKQPGYLEYSDETFINDVLYGLGVALDGHEYFAAQGFDRFKARLLEHLEADRAMPQGLAKAEAMLCIKDVCEYCDGRARGYDKAMPAGNGSGNWVHPKRNDASVSSWALCRATAIRNRITYRAWVDQQGEGK